MPIDLGKWSWAANMALDWGAPALATAFGIPGPVSSFAIGALKRKLGLAPIATEADVKATMDADPALAKEAVHAAQSEVTAKYAYLTRLAEMQAKVNVENVSQVNKSIREETAKGVSWWHWRHLIGYLVLFYGLVLIAIMIKAAFFSITGAAINDLVNLFNSTTAFTLGLFGLLGYVAQDSTALKTAAITNQATPGIVAATIKSIGGNKK